MLSVSIHAPAWGATSPSEFFPHLLDMFQSTHPRGVRRDGGYVPVMSTDAFQSTHPRGVRRRTARPQNWSSPCFNPRTRVGCDAAPDQRQAAEGRVSIHAPAWGATPSRRIYGSYFGCFNPRTRVGCDPRSCPWPWPLSGFNPRTRVGCDWSGTLALYFSVKVSIHAPAWGATASTNASFISSTSFNPRTRVGCDMMDNPRYARLFDVSIHAPAWGATFSSSTSRLQGKEFQSTHPRGVRLFPCFIQ